MLAQSKVHSVVKISTDIGDFEKVLRDATELFAKRNSKQSVRPPARVKNGRGARYADRRSGSAA